MLLDNLKDYLVPCFTLSLVISYCGCGGYYFYYNLDITSYLSVGDLTLIFAKYCIETLVFLGACWYFPFAYFSKEKRRTKWDQMIGRSGLKKRVLWLFPIVAVVIILTFVFQLMQVILLNGIFLAIALFLLTGMLLIVYAIFEGKLKVSEVPLRDWILSAGIAIWIIFVIPFLTGIVLASHINHDRIEVSFDASKESLATDNKTMIYIGKTSGYFFVYVPSKKITTAYPMDKVKSFQVVATP